MECVIKTCLYTHGCEKCEHNRMDPERNGERSCYLNEDLKGEERVAYLKKLYLKYL